MVDAADMAVLIATLVGCGLLVAQVVAQIRADRARMASRDLLLSEAPWTDARVAERRRSVNASHQLYGRSLRLSVGALLVSVVGSILAAFGSSVVGMVAVSAVGVSAAVSLWTVQVSYERLLALGS